MIDDIQEINAVFIDVMHILEMYNIPHKKWLGLCICRKHKDIIQWCSMSNIDIHVPDHYEVHVVRYLGFRLAIVPQRECILCQM